MARQKKEIHKVEMTDGKRAIIQQLFQEYNIESAVKLRCVSVQIRLVFLRVSGGGIIVIGGKCYRSVV